MQLLLVVATRQRLPKQATPVELGEFGVYLLSCLAEALAFAATGGADLGCGV
jgi:hypothetical protein